MILHEFMSYELLRVIWWLLLGVLLIGFALTDGFDMGVGALIPFVGRTDVERRVAINTVGPVWEGNQVWFILGGGAIFAAWPPLYAVSFSGFYLAMFVVLAAFIVRPVAFKYRSKRDDPRWRNAWDWALFTSGAVPALLFGVAVGNVIQGVPFYFTDDLHTIYEGAWYAKFIGLLDPFSILAGLVSLAMLVMHGAAWLTVKTEGVVQARARAIGSVAALLAVAFYALAGVWMALGVEGFRIVGDYATGGPSNPLHFEVERTASWLTAYADRPWIAIAPVMGIAGGLLTFAGLRAGREVSTLLFSKMAILGVISSVGLTMFPFIMPSSLDPRSSLTVWNSSSSHLTLFIMLVCAVIFMPMILAYTAWVYKVLWGKVTEADVSENSHSVY
ncbi:cytochrome d ubiquinol oxidase subunit II [Paracoccus sp. P2]|uniref:Cytochrome bd-I ubiquinol oxidase subunit 2 apoprotein n=1 Tax=Paracoccus pantotrophus TaxID=82367 RepID=A0A1I5NGT5_PARPN|nr:cytochrome d ubiquinol oxidase subunit II [Paracoccus pantotrophus]MDF3856514.1 cytochrome d ubiquinol oxidase subunit II [Paracoccus pantotrophus]QFG37755.1 cytochrome d ubiquinol oxidase subunit II [Paracoccus pantotrophus]QLH15314.1 cytochrome d ubiquinol oxidase subunit II [Paracoccus pantotrophus]RDD93134.1 cytochrome d ubiquinol oxidase subunit II [Paracoccus pantotrophus]RKS51781.1 cytochrome bd-I ubiquinol oxidase subunit 2 apoprotein [Paracoccus pantotrophus]